MTVYVERKLWCRDNNVDELEIRRFIGDIDVWDVYRIGIAIEIFDLNKLYGR
jgi:hypothetical protein